MKGRMTWEARNKHTHMYTLHTHTHTHTHTRSPMLTHMLTKALVLRSSLSVPHFHTPKMFSYRNIVFTTKSVLSSVLVLHHNGWTMTHVCMIKSVECLGPTLWYLSGTLFLLWCCSLQSVLSVGFITKKQPPATDCRVQQIQISDLV